MAIVTITEAAALAGVSRGTLYNRLQDGTLSRSEGGIDTSELVRVFGVLRAPSPEVTARASVTAAPPASADVTDAPVTPLADTEVRLVETLERRLARADEDAAWLRERLAERERQLLEAQARLDEREAFWVRQVGQLQALLPAPAEMPPKSFWRRLVGA